MTPTFTKTAEDIGGSVVGIYNYLKSEPEYHKSINDDFYKAICDTIEETYIYYNISEYEMGRLNKSQIEHVGNEFRQKIKPIVEKVCKTIQSNRDTIMISTTGIMSIVSNSIGLNAIDNEAFTTIILLIVNEVMAYIDKNMKIRIDQNSK